MSKKWVSEFKFKGTGVLRSGVSGILLRFTIGWLEEQEIRARA